MDTSSKTPSTTKSKAIPEIVFPTAEHRCVFDLVMKHILQILMQLRGTTGFDFQRVYFLVLGMPSFQIIQASSVELSYLLSILRSYVLAAGIINKILMGLIHYDMVRGVLNKFR